MKRTLTVTTSVAAIIVLLVAGPAAAATWTTVPAQSPGSQSGLAAVDLLSAGDGWAVGYNAATGGLAERWNGSRFSVVAGPNLVEPGVNYSGVGLTGVDALSSSTAFAVGTAGFYAADGSQQSDAIAERWNGSSWSRMTVPNTPRINSFSDVKAFSSNDVWAIGRAGDTFSGATLAMHWNGTTWSRVATPSPGTRDNVLTAMAGTASNDLWAVGYYRDLPYGNRFRHSLVLHYNGSTWSRVSAPDVGSFVTLLRDVVSVSPTNAWAVGSANTGTGSNAAVVLHWNGTAWSVAPAPTLGPLNTVTAVTSGSATNLWAAGSNSADSSPYLANWNGSSWTTSAAPTGVAASSQLLESAASGSTVINVGQADTSGAGAFVPFAVRTATG